MIIETIVSTIDNDEKVNFSPFGIKKNKNQIYISPYIPSKTLLNLESTKCAENRRLVVDTEHEQAAHIAPESPRNAAACNDNLLQDRKATTRR